MTTPCSRGSPPPRSRSRMREAERCCDAPAGGAEVSMHSTRSPTLNWVPRSQSRASKGMTSTCLVAPPLAVSPIAITASAVAISTAAAAQFALYYCASGDRDRGRRRWQRAGRERHLVPYARCIAAAPSGKVEENIVLARWCCPTLAQRFDEAEVILESGYGPGLVIAVAPPASARATLGAARARGLAACPTIERGEVARAAPPAPAPAVLR
eukprot:scaffold22551_cov29-Tisochrysis_lutea.AAC.1